MKSHRRRTVEKRARSTIEIRLDGPANDGASVGRDGTGRAVFCDGGLPGELVRVELHTEKKRFARGSVSEVLEPHSLRITPGCATHASGCGGCNLAHAEVSLQAEMKRTVVRDSLIRIGGVDESMVDGLLERSVEAPDLTTASDYRTTVRAAIRDGRAGYRRRASHEVVVPSMCGVSHPLVEDMLLEGAYEPRAGAEVVLRASVATGERMAVVDGDAGAVALPAGVITTSRRELASGRRVHMTEEAAGRSWQVSAESFFQAGPTVATALVIAVGETLGSIEGNTLVDAYAGIGLFGGTVGASAGKVISVERSGSSTEDARVNLAGVAASFVECDVEDWSGEPADVVIADPARRGLGPDAVRVLAACGAQRFVLVSCDTGSLGRDIRLLTGEGYQLDSLQVVNAFPDTSHVETVVGLHR